MCTASNFLFLKTGIGSGTTYLYSAYAPQLAAQLKFSVTQSSTIGLISSLGTALTGPGSGTLVDTQGPSVAIAIGAALVFLGYNVVQQAYSHSYSSFPVIAGAMLCVGAGSTFVLSAVVKCAAVNYPNLQGIATSIPIAAYGLSAFVLSWFSALVVPDNTEGMLWVLCVAPTVLFVFAFFFVRLLPPQEYTSLETEITDEINPTRPHSPGESHELQMVTRSRALTLSDHNDLDEDHEDHENVVVVGLDNAETENSEDLHGQKLLSSALFWIHCLIMGILAGVGQMYIYSCGYVVKALLTHEHPLATMTPNEVDQFLALVHQTQSFHVSIISVSSFAGRLVSGTATDFLVHRVHTSRDWILFGIAVLCLLAQFCGLVISRSSLLWITSGSTGFMYGMCFGAYPMIIGDAFGMNHFTQNWGIITTSPIPTAYLFNWIFGKFYDSNSVEDTSTGNLECTLGIACYSKAYIVTLAASVLVVGLSVLVVFKSNTRSKRLS